MLSYISEAMPRAYADTYEGASLLVATDHGRVWMRDRDRAALLHRLSTNHIEALQPGQGTMTVLTTPIGRMIDLLTVYAFDDALLLISSPGRGAALSSHLRKNIFFNDRVKLEDAGSSLDQRALYGPQAPTLLAQLGLPGVELAAHGVAVTTWHDQLLYVTRTHAIGGNGYWLLAAPETMAQVADALREAGAQLLDPATYDVLRVEQGYPAYARELSQEYIPLETGLWEAVSFNKGCYVGQEIIARMESRGRLAKQLRGLRLAALPTLPTEPTIPLAKLAVGDKEAGDLTSLVVSPRYGLIALGYVRTAYAAVGTRLEIAGVAAEVVELPFR